MGFGYLINLRVPSHYSYHKRINVVVENTSDDLKRNHFTFNNTFTVFLKSMQILLEGKYCFFKAISAAFHSSHILNVQIDPQMIVCYFRLH